MYENVNSTHRINLRYYEDDLHYDSLRVKEGCKAIDFDEAMEKVSPKDAEEPIITGQNEKNRAFWGEKKGEYTDQLLESIYEYLKDKKYPDKILVKETKIER